MKDDCNKVCDIDKVSPSGTTNIQQSSVKKLKCESCDFSTSKQSHLSDHVKRVHLKVKDVCLVCGKEFSNINQHMRVVHKELKSGVTEKVKCQECSKECYDLVKHMAKAHHLRFTFLFECQHCKTRFKTKFTLQRHMQRTHGEKDQCKICGKMISNLQTHVKKVHSKNKVDNAKCENVEDLHDELSSFTSESQNYISSGNIEEDPLDVIFPIPERNYGNSESLEPSEGGDKRQKEKTIFSCSLCKYSTEKSSNYSSHFKLVHMKSKTLCQLCGKEYSNINQHMRVVHKQLRSGLSEKKTCQYCNLQFYGVEKHVRRAHSDRWRPKTVECDLCGDTFSKHCNMLRHQQRIHKNNDNNYIPAD